LTYLSLLVLKNSHSPLCLIFRYGALEGVGGGEEGEEGEA